MEADAMHGSSNSLSSGDAKYYRDGGSPLKNADMCFNSGDRCEGGPVTPVLGKKTYSGPGLNCTNMDSGIGPSYVTLRKKDKKKKKAVLAQPFITPDLNTPAESDPFELEELIKEDALEHAKLKNKSQLLEKETMEINRLKMIETEEDKLSDVEDDLTDFEQEVTGTMLYGEGLGIEVDGFDNHVRKLIKGEREENGNQ